MRNKIGQWVFDLPECPKDVTCAAVDGDGVAAWYTTDPKRVTIHSTGNFWVRDDWSTCVPIPGIFCSRDWRNSKIIKEKKMEKIELPTVKAGDLIKVSGGDCYWVFDSQYAYAVRAGTMKLYVDSRVLIDSITDIVEVWRGLECSPMSVYDMIDIIEGKVGCGKPVIQVYNKSMVKEMTVDQISEALGYKVKVVGDDQH